MLPAWIQGGFVRPVDPHDLGNIQIQGGLEWKQSSTICEQKQTPNLHLCISATSSFWATKRSYVPSTSGSSRIASRWLQTKFSQQAISLVRGGRDLASERMKKLLESSRNKPKTISGIAATSLREAREPDSLQVLNENYYLLVRTCLGISGGTFEPRIIHFGT